MFSISGDCYSVPGYICTEVLYASQSKAVNMLVQRGYAIQDPTIKVICKGSGQSDDEANRRIEHEYETLKFLSSKLPGDAKRSSTVTGSSEEARLSTVLMPSQMYSPIPRPIEIVRDRGAWTLVVEDAGGLSLRKFQDLVYTKSPQLETAAPTARKIPLETALTLAIQIAEALKLTIAAGVVHKDINPDNIVVIQAPNERLFVQLIDFNMSTVKICTSISTSESSVLQGTMAYMAPANWEAAKKHGLSISFGVTLWEVLVGRPAFHFDDMLEYMRAHIAIEIDSPSKVDPTIPEALALIIQKLVKKAPEARYQSVYGLKCDLMSCFKTLAKFKQENHIPSNEILTDEQVFAALEEAGPFVAGIKDCSNTVNIPKGKLYGQPGEQAVLNYIEKVLADGAPSTEYILIGGEKGMGKNSLLAVARSKIVATGNFCSKEFII
ncbi:hypothetical protein HDU98_008394 [Podochytrium sp. JEL0797]|nr:hypothetical protein HDU98_008394 [Podochytrium sp. JEL0797]